MDDMVVGWEAGVVGSALEVGREDIGVMVEEARGWAVPVVAAVTKPEQIPVLAVGAGVGMGVCEI